MDSDTYDFIILSLKTSLERVSTNLERLSNTFDELNEILALSNKEQMKHIQAQSNVEVLKKSDDVIISKYCEVKDNFYSISE